MRSNKKSFILNIFIVSIICFTLSFNIGFTRIKSNGAGGGYGGGGGESTDGTGQNNMTIENYIVEGAGHFLRAKKDIQKLLEIVELQDIQGIGFDNMNRVVDNALVNINHAIETYDSLIETAEATPYNESVLNKLRYFDYFGYMMENVLNWIVFNKVEAYLRNGNITGVFKHSRSMFLEVRQLLNNIKEEVSMQRLPEISVFRKLNETCDEISLFGSYVARVFYTLHRNK
ncbi:MAG: hypothetical protein GTO45_11695 [Candidatus Aminicenantes bacterium]|nr:hypothetical protein [Candidatus Aminicenantes bacterium]NIM79468.1 hypothetical protein [Candidatus Aminicenantes bacterium]NIN18754.1 hypothetical protein [Candidatus Aminicenantes bacterium]NIN42676.1 hypothetical protein [Candidatus Aminicenantes bacterium]NIN85410.1 hypothetical protein [Candidatus Aminicenantes bacterium]